MRNFIKLLPLLLLPVIICAGCNIITGNKLIVIKITPPDLNVSGESDGFEVREVSREMNDTWDEHHDQIRHLVDLGFAMLITNNLSSDATAAIYVSERSDLATKADIMEQATRVIKPVLVPGDDYTKITWQQSYDYLENFDTLKKLVLTGKFFVYAVGVQPTTDVTFSKTAVIMTINAEP
jgi:hypothetical protein